MDYQALYGARLTIKKLFGELSDLEEELQNTIVNIYYNAEIIGRDPQKYGFEKGLNGIKQRIIDANFYLEAASSLPEMIRLLREDAIQKGDVRRVKLISKFLLFSFKYRLENVSSRPYYFLKLMQLLSLRKVNEIPNLFRLIKDNSSKYETFQDWYNVFKSTAVKLSPHIKINEKGDCLMDFMEHEPLERAFKDGVAPQLVAIEYANNFLNRDV